MYFKKLLLLYLCGSLGIISYGQSYNTDKVDLTNYLKRMYNAAPYEGVRVVEDYDNCYLLSVLTLDNAKYNNESAMNRVASVKAMSQASRYFNGADIRADIIIRTREDYNGIPDTEIIENIKEHSVGYVKEMELLTSFTTDNNRTAFIFCKMMDMK